MTEDANGEAEFTFEATHEGRTETMDFGIELKLEINPVGQPRKSALGR